MTDIEIDILDATLILIGIAFISFAIVDSI
jgi:hypothetical protein